MKKIVLFLLSISMMCASAVIAFADGAYNQSMFLCMKSGSSMALENSGNQLNYVKMCYVDENNKETDENVEPFVTSERTYLPMRYICEKLGLTSNDGGLTDNYFMYNGNNGDDATVTIKVNGKENVLTGVVYETAVNCSYEELDNKFINRDGRVYVPLRQLGQYILGMSVGYDDETKNVYIYTPEMGTTFLREDNNTKLKEGLMPIPNRHTYSANANALNYSDIYLNPIDEVRYLTGELADGNVYYSVSRRDNTLYFCDKNKKAYSYTPFIDAKPREIQFTDSNGTSINNNQVYVDQMIYMQGALYGISTSTVDDYTGSVFKADLDGKNFKVISDTADAFNIVTNNNNIYYVAGAGSNEIYRLYLPPQGNNTEVKPEKLTDTENSIYFMVITEGNNREIVYSDSVNGYIHRVEYQNGEYIETGVNKTLSDDDHLTICSMNANTSPSGAEEARVYYLYQNQQGQRIVKWSSFDDINTLHNMGELTDERMIKLTVLNNKVYVAQNGNLKDIN